MVDRVRQGLIGGPSNEGRDSSKLPFRAAFVAFSAGVILTAFFFCVMLVSVVGFWVGVPITPWHGYAGFLLAVVLVAALTPCSWRELSVAALVALILIVGSCVLSAQFIDGSYDGNGYQKAAVVQLAEGWNPLQGSVAAQASFQELYGSNEYIAMRTALWVDHYAEGPWDIAASLYRACGVLEAGKAYTLIAMAEVALLVGGYLGIRRFRAWQSVVVGLVAAVNPVTVAQFTVFYVDGFLMLSLLSLLVGLAMLVSEDRPEMLRPALGLSFVAFCVCANVKFTGLAYAGVFALSFALLLLYLGMRYPERYPRRRIVLSGVVLVAAVFFAVCVLGFAPYITNLIEAGNPLYPLFGADAVDIMTSNTPPGFSEMSPFERLMISLFGVASNVHGGSELIEYGLKVPFSVSADELDALTACDLRISGFGVLFSGLFVICAACLPFLLVWAFRARRTLFQMSVAYLAPTLLLLLAMGDSWWARYSCYAYFVCPLVLVLLFAAMRTCSHQSVWRRVAGGVGLLIVAIAFVNVGYFVRCNVIPAYEQTKELQATMTSWKAQLADGTKELEVAGADARLGLVYALREADVPFTYAGTAVEGFEEDGEFLFGFYRLSSPFAGAVADAGQATK